jgi:hypothetical protein
VFDCQFTVKLVDVMVPALKTGAVGAGVRVVTEIGTDDVEPPVFVAITITLLYVVDDTSPVKLAVFAPVVLGTTLDPLIVYAKLVAPEPPVQVRENPVVVMDPAVTTGNVGAFGSVCTVNGADGRGVESRFAITTTE